MSCQNLGEPLQHSLHSMPDPCKYVRNTSLAAEAAAASLDATSMKN